MADTKITGLAALTTPADEDLLAIVDDPSGTPVTKKVTLANLLKNTQAWAQMYVATGVGTQNLTTATWTKIDQFAANGDSLNATVDHSLDKITLGAVQGRYLVNVAMSFTLDAATDVEFTVYLDGSPLSTLQARVRTVSGVAMHVSMVGVANVDAGAEDLEVWVKHGSGSDQAFVVKDASLFVEKLPF